MFSKGKKGKKGGRSRKKPAPPTIISSDLHIEGNVTCEGEIQIDGVIDGDVTSGKLSIGTSGTIKGAVTADRMLVRGSITGQIKSRLVTLTRTARVTGDVLHVTLAIEPGARLEGNCRRMDGGSESNINLVVSDGASTRSGV